MRQELACEYWDLESAESNGGPFKTRSRHYSKDEAFKQLDMWQNAKSHCAWRLRHVRQELHWSENK